MHVQITIFKDYYYNTGTEFDGKRGRVSISATQDRLKQATAGLTSPPASLPKLGKPARNIIEGSSRRRDSFWSDPIYAVPEIRVFVPVGNLKNSWMDGWTAASHISLSNVHARRTVAQRDGVAVSRGWRKVFSNLQTGG